MEDSNNTSYEANFAVGNIKQFIILNSMLTPIYVLFLLVPSLHACKWYHHCIVCEEEGITISTQCPDWKPMLLWYSEQPSKWFPCPNCVIVWVYPALWAIGLAYSTRNFTSLRCQLYTDDFELLNCTRFFCLSG